MSYEETVKEIEKTLDILSGFFKDTPKDILPHMWPLFKKYQIGDSVIPKKYREMMMLASAAATKCAYCQTSHRGCKNVWCLRTRVTGISCYCSTSAFCHCVTIVSKFRDTRIPGSYAEADDLKCLQSTISVIETLTPVLLSILGL